MRFFSTLVLVLSLAACTEKGALYDDDGGAQVGQAPDGTRIPLPVGQSVTVRAVFYVRGYETTTLEVDDLEPRDPSIARVEPKLLQHGRLVRAFELTALSPGQTELDMWIDGERRGCDPRRESLASSHRQTWPVFVFVQVPATHGSFRSHVLKQRW